MSILVTGVAGFIGFHVAKALLRQGYEVLGIDNLNEYYDVNLKKKRLSILEENSNFSFFKIAIDNTEAMDEFRKSNSNITKVINLAAQAGVRYSLINPYAYGNSNLIGHLNILELCRRLDKFEHLVYASSSSVYGANKKLPFAVTDRTDHPISLYAATKKSCELMSQSYSHLFDMKISGLRYFTVYGDWGRPDMSAFIFTKAILSGQKMPVFNHGKMRRNFTFINDIVAGTIGCLNRKNLQDDNNYHKIYNIGNNRSEELMDFVKTLEDLWSKKANIEFLPLQDGDVVETIADISESHQDFGFSPKTDIRSGLEIFVDWYKKFYINNPN